MARTQAADYGERRAAILDSAIRLFAEHGFEGSSIADVAKACSTSKSLIYHYFPSKDDMLFEAMEQHVEALESAAEAVRREGGTPREQLDRLTHAFMRLYAGAETRHKVLLNELDKLPAPRRGEVVERQRRLIAFVEQLIGALEPSLAADAPRRRATTMLYFGMINWTHTWFHPDGPIASGQLADMVIGMLRRRLPGVSDQAS